MLNPYQKSHIKFSKSKDFEKSTIKPSILATFESLVGASEYKRSGRALLALCPIHGESNPSCALYEDTNSFHCFSCGASGDSYSLLMKVLDVSFTEAKEYASANGLYHKI